jgi:hypothetical protein
MGNSVQHFLGCNKAHGQGCPPSGPPVLSKQHHRGKVHMLDQTK